MASLRVAPAWAFNVPATWRRSWNVQSTPATVRASAHRLRHTVGVGVVPSGHRKERMHLDIETDDVEAEVSRLEALGAVRRTHQTARGYDYWVMHDPWGNEFCVLQPTFPALLAETPPWEDPSE